jgi:hypothetical protein
MDNRDRALPQVFKCISADGTEKDFLLHHPVVSERAPDGRPRNIHRVESDWAVNDPATGVECHVVGAEFTLSSGAVWSVPDLAA